MRKRGQLTLFVIVAVVVFFGIVSYVALQDVSDTASYPASVRGMYDVFIDCVTDDFVLSLEDVGLFGITDTKEVPRYYDAGTVLLPSALAFEAYLSERNTNTMQNCALFAGDAESLYTARAHNLRAEVTLYDERVVLEPQGMFIVSHNETTYAFDVSVEPIVVVSELYALHAFTTRFVTALREDAEAVPVSALNDFARDQGLVFHFDEDFEEGTLLVVVTSREGSVPEMWWFDALLVYPYPSEVGFLL